MNPPVRRIELTIGIGILLLALTLGLAFLLAKSQSRVANAPPPVYGTVAAFTLTNQDNQPVTLADLRGRVWVADIIFTRCAGPCLRMTAQMRELQYALPADDTTKLVSLTTDADFDTPAVLSRYAVRFSADTNRWMFLTGTKEEIANVATGSLKLSAVERKPEERQTPDDLFVHSTIFVLVDKQGRLRGIYQTGGEDVAWAKTKQDILAAIRKLEREP